MSYRCQKTGKVIGPSVPMNKVITEKRERIYEVPILSGPEKGYMRQVKGWEIVTELVVGPDAYKEMTGEEPNRVKPSEVSQEARVVDREPAPWRNRRDNRQPFRQKRPEVQHVRSSKQGPRS